ETTVADIVDDVRHRDEERLSIQAAGQKDPGVSMSNPEPLVKPKHEGRRIDRVPDMPDTSEPSRG
ncbi:hypothetical protein, partial [Salmonella enterica]|uniref:hypothetical protein n=1 Tax=Salmonella enterica TaxID=28901 RepID=UPI003296FD57